MDTKTKERPIIFNAEMVRAILDGRKTQTRRVVRKPKQFQHNAVHPNRAAGHFWWFDDIAGFSTGVKALCPFGRVGSKLWVRETARGRCYGGKKGKKPDWIELLYRADEAMVQFDRDDFGPYKLTGRWTPSIFMPHWASRITLEITGVHVERVQAINYRDAIAEGIKLIRQDPPFTYWSLYVRDGEQELSTRDPCWSFKMLWNLINDKRGFGWDTNPWVWVIEFQQR